MSESLKTFLGFVAFFGLESVGCSSGPRYPAPIDTFVARNPSEYIFIPREGDEELGRIQDSGIRVQVVERDWGPIKIVITVGDAMSEWECVRVERALMSNPIQRAAWTDCHTTASAARRRLVINHGCSGDYQRDGLQFVFTRDTEESPGKRTPLVFWFRERGPRDSETHRSHQDPIVAGLVVRPEGAHLALPKNAPYRSELLSVMLLALLDVEGHYEASCGAQHHRGSGGLL